MIGGGGGRWCCDVACDEVLRDEVRQWSRGNGDSREVEEWVTWGKMKMIDSPLR